MYSFNVKKEMQDSVIDMVKTGESNIGFMMEVLKANWQLTDKEAKQIVLESIFKAQKN
jgi:hypothetical protein